LIDQWNRYRKGGGQATGELGEIGNAVEFARERLGFEPDAKQAWLLRERRRRVLLNCTRQWGKSTVTAARAVWECWSRPGSLTVVVSPSARQSAEFVRKAAEFARRLGWKPRGDGDNEISLAMPNESRIVGLPGKEGTIRGFSAVSLLVVDEAARVPDAMYQAVKPMLAVANGDLWLMSTPYGKRGFFYEEWASARGWDRLAVPATECARISGAFLAEERESVGEEWFRQEYLCEFVDVGGAFFDRDTIERAFTEEIQPLAW
jgi:hypothetical protein